MRVLGNCARMCGCRDERCQGCASHIMTAVREIEIGQLCLGMYVHKLGTSWLDHPFVRSSFLLETQEDLRKIQDIGISTVWIDESKGLGLGESTAVAEVDAPEEWPVELASPVEEEAQQGGKERSLAPTSMVVELEHARAFCLAAKEEVKQLFADLRMGKTVTEASVIPLVEEISASISRNQAALISVARLKTHDDYTYLHSVAVCGLMLALAKQLGLDDMQTKKAGVGGLMHDFGKAFMPLDVLNKPGKLTDDEFAIMKQHPVEGARALQQSGASAEAVDIALHHHEKISGLGYPHGLKGNEITLLARMGAVCDVYDAVTSVRAYKEPWDPAMAMHQMAQWQGHFDTSIFNAFVKSVGIYPVGSLVRLASNRLAVVTEPGKHSLLSPIVRVFHSLTSQQDIHVETVDLGAPSCRDSIVARMDPAVMAGRNLNAYWQ